MVVGLYDVESNNCLQQEGTFWRRELNQYIDLDKFASLRLAGDYYLWHQFAQHTKLKIVEAYLGGFRVHDGRLSEDLAGYTAEMRTLADKPTPWDRLVQKFDLIMANYPNHWSTHWRHATRLIYDHSAQQWRWRE
jgi:hypothetical protein